MFKSTLRKFRTETYEIHISRTYRNPKTQYLDEKARTFGNAVDKSCKPVPAAALEIQGENPHNIPITPHGRPKVHISHILTKSVFSINT